MIISVVSLLKVPRRHFGISLVAFWELLLFLSTFVGTLRSVPSFQRILRIFWKLFKSWMALVLFLPSFVKHLIFLGCHQSLLILCIGEQVWSNTQTLHTLSAAVSGVEDKLGNLMDQMKVLFDSNKTTETTTVGSAQTATSYANVVSSHTPVNIASSVQPKLPAWDDSRAPNVILFGLPEGKSIFKSKAVVDEVFEFLAGQQVLIKDIFRLGKFNQSSRPHPLLVKLSGIWDKKLLLSHKRIFVTLRSSVFFCVKMFLLSISFINDPSSHLVPP